MRLISDNEWESTLAQQGWLALDLPDSSPVFSTRDRLLEWLRKRKLHELNRLEDYHLLIHDDQHVDLIHGLAKYYWEAELGKMIISANLHFFRELLGTDLLIQRRPYLRVVRPYKTLDAAPLHRDTYYGASPYEVSILVPLTDMDADAALRVITGSHLAPDSDYPYTQQVSEDVTIRSPKHELGYPYAPRVLSPELFEKAQPVPLTVGQVLIFGLSLVHGGGTNNSPYSRFSTDIRVVNALAPVARHRGVHKDYFIPLCTSAVSGTAQNYLEVNQVKAQEKTLQSSWQIQCIDPTQDSSWLTLLKHPEAGIFHSPPWFRVLADTYGFLVRAYIVTDTSGNVIGGIPFCEIKDSIAQRVISLPFTDVCDPLIPSLDVWPVLLAKLQSHNLPLELRCLQDDIATDQEGFTVTRSKRWHHLSITPSPEELWSRMTDANQRAIRAAQRAGVEIRPLVGSEGCEAFLGLHVALRKQKFHLLAQPLSFFEAIAKHFSEIDGWYPLGAFLDGRLIAATIYLRWGDTLYFKFSASDMNALKVRPNNLLIWSGMLLGRSLGCQVLDLGPSDDDQPGLIRFKRNFGVEERSLRFSRWTPPGFMAEDTTEIRQLLRNLTSLLTRPEVPDEVTMQAGDLLYRFFT